MLTKKTKTSASQYQIKVTATASPTGHQKAKASSWSGYISPVKKTGSSSFTVVFNSRVSPYQSYQKREKITISIKSDKKAVPHAYPINKIEDE